MTKLKKALLSKSLFRQCYIICLFACNISYVHFLAYGVLVLLVVWGAFLTVYHEITRRTALRTRYGFWLIALFLSSVVTTGNLLFYLLLGSHGKAAELSPRAVQHQPSHYLSHHHFRRIRFGAAGAGH